MSTTLGIGGVIAPTAEWIARKLQQPGMEVELRSIAEPADVAGFDAFVLGSSIYMGHWNKEAVASMRRNQLLLKGHSDCLFSSGPIGNQERVEPVELADLMAVVSVREHKLFGGALKLD